MTRALHHQLQSLATAESRHRKLHQQVRSLATSRSHHQAQPINFKYSRSGHYLRRPATAKLSQSVSQSASHLPFCSLCNPSSSTTIHFSTPFKQLLSSIFITSRRPLQCRGPERSLAKLRAKNSSELEHLQQIADLEEIIRVREREYEQALREVQQAATSEIQSS
jgi:hypothetical protein